MKVVMLSRLEQLRLGIKPRIQQSATEQLRDRLYKKYPPKLLVSETEAPQRKMWNRVANKVTARRKV